MVPNHGQHANAEDALADVVARLVAGLDPIAIYLFGSRARGDARADSDFDLLVVMDDELGDLADDYDRARAPLRGSGVGCDVVPVARWVFMENRNDVTTLSYQAFHHGRKLYNR